jgi:four helix bundle protein
VHCDECDTHPLNRVMENRDCEKIVVSSGVSKPEELRGRTKKFAMRIIRLFQHLPRSPEAQILGKQLLRAGTSVGANYRAAGRARSKPEFIAKMGIVVEEAAETVFCLECRMESGIMKPKLLTELLAEANELVAIFAASQRTARHSL